MTFSEINAYFEIYGIPTNHKPSYNSKYVYVKEVLPKIGDEIILEIASELRIDHPIVSNLPIIKEEEANFWKPGHFRLFISHLASFKKTITILKNELEKFGISSFVAHEDIEPTKEWQNEIEKGLFSMDALCAVLMPGFNESKWTDQEIGVALGRGTLVIPIRRGLNPYGFIGKYQGFQVIGKNVGEVAKGIFEIISQHPKTKSKFMNNLIELFLLSINASEALQRIKAFKKIKGLPVGKAILVQDRIIENENLKHFKVLNEFNELMQQFGLREIQSADFESKVIDETDDFPF